LERERFLSPPFIHGPDYGTRASSVVLVSRDREATIIERNFGPDGVPAGEKRIEIPLRFGA
jgi:uncharacterized protein with NRDE domain